MVSLLSIPLLFELIHLSACQLDPSSLLPIIKRDVYSSYNNRASSLSTPQSVLDLFSTKSNTIIRTKESRDFGARYLNESEQMSQEECINWCWNYKSSADNSSPCNVAVYEQKDRKSCYLFDCGSPASFKCKFTDHDSFTSSILNITRQTYDLNRWKDQSQHESELKSLLRIKVFQNLGKSISNDVSTTKIPSNSWNPNNVQLSRNRCQHYQFPCKNGTDCVAIYNVCDGIAQCPDGNDEGADLKCPPTFVSEIPPQRPRVEPTYKPMNSKGVGEKGPPEDVLTNPRIFAYPKAPEPSEIDLSLGRRYNGNKFGVAPSIIKGRGMNDLRGMNDGGGFRYSSNNNPFSPFPQTGAEYLNPAGSYLFPDADYSRDLTPLFWSPVQAVPPPPSSRNEILRPEKINLDSLTQPMIRLSELAKKQGHNRNWNSFVSKDGSLPPRDSFDGRPIDVQVSPFVLKPRGSPPPATIATATVPIDSVTSAKPSFLIQEEQKIQSQFHSSALLSSREAIAVTHLRDPGTSGRDTNSAIIALTLGICITVMLVVLVGCRMKSIHRKIAQRGGRSLAHDADYLVNGMYL